MTRSREYEFTAKTKREAYARSKGMCERCGLPFNHKNKPEYNHIKSVFEMEGRPDECRALGNCEVLGGSCCHPQETKRQASEVFPKIRREDRRKANIPKRIKGRGFTQKPKKTLAEKMQELRATKYENLWSRNNDES